MERAKELDVILNGENVQRHPESQKNDFTAHFPFRPLNGFLVITVDPGSADPARGTVLAVCQSLKGQVFPGDFVMYPAGTCLTTLSFGKGNSALINVTAIYGVWDAEELHRIERETQGRPGKPGRALTFDLERGVGG